MNRNATIGRHNVTSSKSTNLTNRRWTIRIGLASATFASLIAISAFGTSSEAGASTVPKPGVVTVSMAMVGDPGNPSVGVIQTFGLTGNKATKVDPPENSGSTGIYKSCGDAPTSTGKSCLTVGGVSYKYGIGEYDTTVSQYVTFLNTVDPRGRNTLKLYFDDMSPVNWPKYGSISYSSSAATGQHYTVAYPEWANKPFNFASFSAGSALRQLADQRQSPLQDVVVSERIQLRHLQSPALARRRRPACTTSQNRQSRRIQVHWVCRSEQQRMGQGGVLRPQGRWDRFVLGLRHGSL